MWAKLKLFGLHLASAPLWLLSPLSLLPTLLPTCDAETPQLWLGPGCAGGSALPEGRPEPSRKVKSNAEISGVQRGCGQHLEQEPSPGV